MSHAHDTHNIQGVQMEVITIAIQKGGKTTTACILSHAAVYRQKKILAMDKYVDQYKTIEIRNSLND